MLRLLFHLARAILRTAWSRLRRGPLRPTWSFGFECLVTMMRSFTAWMSTLDVAAQRRIAAKLVGRSPEQRRVRMEDVTADGVSCVWFVPDDHDSSRVVLYLHGGGFVFGSARQDSALIAKLAVGARARVLAVDYRLAPEHPCPAAIEDAVTAFEWLLAKGHDPAHVSFAGLSAGGGIAVAALMALRDRGAKLPARAALLSPGLDVTATAESFVSNARYDYFGDVDMRAALAPYAGALDPRDPRVSPAYGDPRGLPPLLLHVGAVEMLRDTVIAFAEKAKGAGVTVELGVFEDLVHAFHAFGAGHAEIARALDELCAFLRQR